MSMTLYDLIISRRTIREFEDKLVPRKLLDKFVNAGRLAPQAANRQPLEFIVVDDPITCADVFKYIALAGHIEWSPSIEKMPRAYVVIVSNTEIQKAAWVSYDVACAAENICLASWEEGIGSCMIGAFNKNEIRDLFDVPPKYEIYLLVALGFPSHKADVVEMEGDDFKYRRDANGTFHVPKRPLKKVTHYNKF